MVAMSPPFFRENCGCLHFVFVIVYTLHSGVPGQVAPFQRLPTNISGSGQNIGRLWQKERELDADATKVVTVADSWSTSESWTFMELLISYDFTMECLDLFLYRKRRKFVLFFAIELWRCFQDKSIHFWLNLRPYTKFWFNHKWFRTIHQRRWKKPVPCIEGAKPPYSTSSVWFCHHRSTLSL